VLGIFSRAPQEYLEERKKIAVQAGAISEAEIQKKISERRDARKAKNFKLSDQIRDELLSQGILLKDNPDGTTTWTVK